MKNPQPQKKTFQVGFFMFRFWVFFGLGFLVPTLLIVLGKQRIPTSQKHTEQNHRLPPQSPILAWVTACTSSSSEGPESFLLV